MSTARYAMCPSDDVCGRSTLILGDQQVKLDVNFRDPSELCVYKIKFFETEGSSTDINMHVFDMDSVDISIYYKEHDSIYDPYYKLGRIFKQSFYTFSLA